MTLDFLKDPISDDAPCGPNLEEEDHDGFVEYFYEAEARMPERYFTPGISSGGEGRGDQLFDPASVDLKFEREQITGLLKESRDLRLLSLLARFSALAGNLPSFAEAVDGMATLLETFPRDVYPTTADGPSDRRGTLEDLTTIATVIMPLQHADMAPPNGATLRYYMVANGEASPRGESEENLSTSAVTSALGDAGAAAKVEEIHASLVTARGALARIRSACLGDDNQPFNVNLEATTQVLDRMLELVHQARGDLAAAAEPAEEAPADDGAPDGAEATGDADTAADAAPAAPPPTPSAGATSIGSQAAARTALQAIEGYFATKEPTSAAVLLVTQARLLIGKPLIEAIETLLPNRAGAATIDFGASTGFALPMDRLRMLSGEAPKSGPTEEAVATPPAINNRADVAANLKGVEDYYRINQPASPIPLLLARARIYLDKDFQSLITELLPKETPTE